MSRMVGLMKGLVDVSPNSKSQFELEIILAKFQHRISCPPYRVATLLYTGIRPHHNGAL